MCRQLADSSDSFEITPVRNPILFEIASRTEDKLKHVFVIIEGLTVTSVSRLAGSDPGRILEVIFLKTFCGRRYNDRQDSGIMILSMT